MKNFIFTTALFCSSACLMAQPLQYQPNFLNRVSGTAASDETQKTIAALERSKYPVFVSFGGTAPVNWKTVQEGQCGGYEFTRSPFFNDVMFKSQTIVTSYFNSAKFPKTNNKSDQTLLISICIDPDTVRLPKPLCAPVNIGYRYVVLRGSLAEAERRVSQSVTVNGCNDDQTRGQKFSVIYDSGARVLVTDASDADFSGVTRALTPGERGNAAVNAIPYKLAKTLVEDPSLANAVLALSDSPSKIQERDTPSSTKINSAKTKCQDLGLKDGTEKFGECVLRLSR
jgi:hypothetical protein